MAATNVTKLYSGQTGSTSNDQRSYVEVYAVDVDSATDGKITVENAVHVAYGIVIGLTYYRNFSEVDVEAKAKDFSSSRVEGTRLRWTVQVTYETPPKNDKGDESSEPQPDANGNLTDEPNDWRERIEWGANVFAKPVTDAKLLSDKIPKIRAVDSRGPIVVASGEVVDPPPEMDDHDVALRITKFSRTFPNETAATYKNSTNNDAFEIRKPGLHLKISKYESRLLPITGSLNYHTQKSGTVVPYWQVNYELLIRWIGEDSVGWRVAQLNHGYFRRQLAGDHSVEGGSLSQSTVDRRRQNGLAAMARLTDAESNPIGPLLLDYDGQPLKAGENALYLLYSHLKEKSYGSLKIWR